MTPNPLTITSTVTLNNGVEMPRLGLGTFQSEAGKPTQEAVRWALEAGYRHIDTAAMYRNEQDVGKAIRDSGIPRSEIFVTTKVWNADHGYDKALRAFQVSQTKLGLDPIDLYLIHWPTKADFGETWRALETLYREKRVRAIGVSNFLIHHLETLLETAEITPAVNQIEFHPFNVQAELLAFCRKAKIQVEAWSPLGRGQFFDHPLLKEIAQRHQRSCAQVLIRWDLQHEVVTIPRSTREAHIRENSEVFDFELSAVEMSRLDALDEGKRVGPDPDTFVGF